MTMLPTSLPTLLLGLAPLLAQDPAPNPPDPLPPEVGETHEANANRDEAAPARPQLPQGLRDKIARPFADLQPGVLPEGTDPAAAALFRQLVDGSRIDEPGAVAGRVTGFDLAFELIVRGEGVERNQFETRVRYAEPGHVRFAVRDQYEMGFGPTGYWQVMEDGYRELAGRDYASDRQRIVEVRAVCRNFLALAEPERLRVAALRPVAGLEPRTAAEVLLGAEVVRPLPPTQDDQGAGRPLRWLEIESPDFDLALGATPEDVDPGRLFRATVGVDPETGRVAEALVQELREGRPLLTTSTWVTLGRHLSIDGVLLPEAIQVRYPDLSTGRLRFEAKPREEMYLLEGHLNPNVGDDAFAPRRESGR